MPRELIRPTNPNLDIYDISSIATIAHEAGATLVVDNAMGGPLVQRPLELGADCVIYSATKHVDGQGRCLGGVVLASEDFIQSHVHDFLRQTGPAISPFNAWVMLKSLETLPLRIAAQQTSALKLADFLNKHEAVTRVIYPGQPSHPNYELANRQMKGGGTIVCFEVRDGKSGAFRLSNALKVILLSNNFGDTKSILTHPLITTHQRLSAEVRAELGITDGMLRLSVGLEAINDLKADLSNALDAV